MTHKNTWKAFERKVANFFFARRNPLSGSMSGHTSGDAIDDEIYVECKLRAKNATVTLFEDTRKKAKAEGEKIPIVALKIKGHKGWLLVIQPEDLQTLAATRKERLDASKEKETLSNSGAGLRPERSGPAGDETSY